MTRRGACVLDTQARAAVGRERIEEFEMSENGELLDERTVRFERLLP
jgi:hypothetical protein